jgi:hypothetical protein
MIGWYGEDRSCSEEDSLYGRDARVASPSAESAAGSFSE